MMKKIILVFTFLLFNSIYSIGISDWKATTPMGNEINNFSQKTLYLKDGKQVDNIAKWYFYNNRIVGTIINPLDRKADIEYFIVNELSYEIFKFNDEKEWLDYLKNNNLKPIIWTRWYSGDWSFSFFKIIIPIIITFSIIIFFYKRKRRKKNQFIKKLKSLIFLCVLIITSVCLLQYFPQSF